ncbi:MAG: hypothetical protein IB618_01920 [Candidatus Pacearchaeota archaeon]|nr:MAG: hypothetical protein IB618_01920 [Candidatus Pacearchaeota archaeon]
MLEYYKHPVSGWFRSKEIAKNYHEFEKRYAVIFRTYFYENEVLRIQFLPEPGLMNFVDLAPDNLEKFLKKMKCKSKKDLENKVIVVLGGDFRQGIMIDEEIFKKRKEIPDGQHYPG